MRAGSQALTTARADGARFIYVLPNFQNPTGLTLSRERREAPAKRCAELDVPIIEDDPYGELRYAGEPQPSLLEVSVASARRLSGLVVFQGIGARPAHWLHCGAQADYLKLVQIKQATDSTAS